MDAGVETVLRSYPKIYFACHLRHVRDRQTQKVLSAHQASVLDHLDDVEPTSLLALAQHMGVTAATMSLMVDRLEGSGYLTRDRSEQDKRRIDIRLTSAGARIKRQDKVLDPNLVAAVLARLDDRHRRKALDGLELLAQAAEEMIRSGDLKRFLRGEKAS